MQRLASAARSPLEASGPAREGGAMTRKGFDMRILTKGMMGLFVAASVVGTVPAYAGVASAVPGYHSTDASADYYKKRKHDRRHYAQRDQRVNSNTDRKSVV